jgi:hypothetical protein
MHCMTERHKEKHITSCCFVHTLACLEESLSLPLKFEEGLHLGMVKITFFDNMWLDPFPRKTEVSFLHKL